MDYQKLVDEAFIASRDVYKRQVLVCMPVIY